MPTRKDFRRALAAELGGYVLTSNNTSTGDATKLNLVIQGTSTELAATAFGYVWAYVPSIAGIPQARIKKSGLDITTGQVTLESTLGAVAAAGADVELHSVLPAVDDSHSFLGGGSADGCVNRALRHIYIEDCSVTYQLVSGQFDYPLTALADVLDDARRLKDVLIPNGAGTTTDMSFHDWEIRQSASGPVLHFFQPFAFSSGTYSMTLRISRRASSLIYVNGVWGISTVGLVNETDQAIPSVNDVVTVALYFAYGLLAARNHGAARAGYLARQQAQLALAGAIDGFEIGTADATPPPAAPTAAPPAGVPA